MERNIGKKQCRAGFIECTKSKFNGDKIDNEDCELCMNLMNGLTKEEIEKKYKKEK
jgi:hypothetical protein